jgi:hypothetical protein
MIPTKKIRRINVKDNEINGLEKLNLLSISASSKIFFREKITRNSFIIDTIKVNKYNKIINNIR